MSAGNEAARLAAVLDEESGLLERGDYRRVNLLFARKEAAMAAFDEAAASGSFDRASAEQLAQAAERNRRALLRALRVQGRVLNIVAEAMRRAAFRGRYGARTAKELTGFFRARA